MKPNELNSKLAELFRDFEWDKNQVYRKHQDKSLELYRLHEDKLISLENYSRLHTMITDSANAKIQALEKELEYQSALLKAQADDK